MKNKIFRMVFVASVIIAATQNSNAQEYGKFAIGFQRGIWALYGPSFTVDLNRKIGFETVLGIVPPNAETNANLGIFERILVRPVTFKTNSLYAAGMLGTSHWHYLGGYDDNFVEAYEWGLNLGLVGGAEFDTRMLIKKFLPLFINVEGGIEHRQTKYTTSATYGTFGLGIHYRF
jgi:hypothetical protein